VTGIELHIERLVLDGVPLGSGGAAALQAAVEAELTRLVTDGGLGPSVLSGGAHRVLRGGTVHAGPTTGAGELGTRIARAVHGGLGGPTPP
jgi:hypothetical protein